MNAPRVTLLLSLLLVASTACAAVGWINLSARRADARSGLRDLATCRSELAALSAAGPAAERRRVDDLDANRQVRQAAAPAGLVDHIADIDPGPPTRSAESDFVRTPVRVRVNAVTLRQLIVFLRPLSTDTAEVSDIDLTPSGDKWSADVTVTFVSYDPRSSVPH